MSLQDPNNASSIPPYPSLEESEANLVMVKKSINAADRICWAFDAIWPDAISVMTDSNSLASVKPYCLHGRWHDIAQESLTQPKVSSITVKIGLFLDFERDWIERHHTDFDNQWGPLPDYDPGEDSDREEHLLSCCGESRPRKMNQIKKVVTPASGGFVTIHDYLSTLHPWLMRRKKEIVRAETVWETPFPEMVVDFKRVNTLEIVEKDKWTEEMTGATISLQNVSQAHGFPPSDPGPIVQTVPPALSRFPGNAQFVYGFQPPQSTHPRLENHHLPPALSAPGSNVPLYFAAPPPRASDPVVVNPTPHNPDQPGE